MIRLNLGSHLAQPESGWLNVDFINWVNPRSTRTSLAAMHEQSTVSERDFDKAAAESRAKIARELGHEPAEAELKQRQPQLLADGRRIPFKDDSVDEILAQGLNLEQLWSAMGNGMGTEIFRVLKPGGRCIVGGPSFLNFDNMLEGELKHVGLVLEGRVPDTQEDQVYAGKIWGGYLEDGFEAMNRKLESQDRARLTGVGFEDVHVARSDKPIFESPGDSKWRSTEARYVIGRKPPVGTDQK